MPYPGGVGGPAARPAPHRSCLRLASVFLSYTRNLGTKIFRKMVALLGTYGGSPRRSNCQCPGPAVQHQLVMMLCDPSPEWLMQEATQERTILPWFRPQGRTSSKACASALYYLAPGVPVVGGTSKAREGGKLPILC